MIWEWEEEHPRQTEQSPEAAAFQIFTTNNKKWIMHYYLT